MLKKIHQLESYTGGDQGFLNSYFPDLRNAPLLPILAKDRFTSLLGISSEEAHINNEGIPSLQSPVQGQSMLHKNKSLRTETGCSTPEPLTDCSGVFLTLVSLYSGCLQRLESGMNADLGLYVLGNKWMMPEDSIKVIHFTLGPFKPWTWWVSWFVPAYG